MFLEFTRYKNWKSAQSFLGTKYQGNYDFEFTTILNNIYAYLYVVWNFVWRGGLTVECAFVICWCLVTWSKSHGKKQVEWSKKFLSATYTNLGRDWYGEKTEALAFGVLGETGG